MSDSSIPQARPLPLALAIAALLWAGPSLAQSPEPLGAADPAAADGPQTVTVTGTRERLLLAEAPASIGIVSGAGIRFTAPAHPQQVLGQVPGVAIAVTNGEGHTTAIRQPFTTGPMYLFLEDGVPTRATGFFNHNALYEVNLPAAGSIEVVRGPNTALYGSDAIGGTINVLTRAPSPDARPELRLEAGSHGWWRLTGGGSVGGGTADGPGAVRADVNLTRTDGWRDATGYERASVNLRWDVAALGGDWKTTLGATRIDQQTGANSPLTEADYRDRPTLNQMPIAFRQVGALRITSEYTRESGDTLLTLTPYLRRNSMTLNGSFNLASDPRIERSTVQSVGLLAKWRRDFRDAWRTRLVLGVDLDHSAGRREEDAIAVTRSGSGATTQYTGYTVGDRIYAYDVDTRGLSPYAHAETSPLPGLRLTLGLRHDRLDYAMHNRIGTPTTRAGSRLYAQQPDAGIGYAHTSPKLGLTWALTPAASLYASFNHGFRTPSEGQLFRAGSATNAGEAQARAALALQLRPIKADQLEVGLRGRHAGWTWDTVVYELVKRDDLVSQRDLATGASTSVNAGKTRHRGLELALHVRLATAWQIDAAWSYARHIYVDWRTGSGDFSGKEMESAPRTVANTRLTWTPRATTRAQLEWVHLGAYWLEASNDARFGRYGGHDVFNLRLRQAFGPALAGVLRVMNLGDRRHADSAGVNANTRVFAPALPRTIYAGLEATW